MDPAASFLANSAPWTAQPGDPSMMNVNQPGPMTGPPPDMGQPNSMPVGVQQDQGQGMDPELHAAAVHHSRLAGILDKVGDILGGNKTLRLTQNPDGSVDATPMDSTRGEKWGRVAQAALKGAATGFSVGQGPGGQGRAAAASTLGAMGDVQVQQDKTIADAMKSNDQNQRRKLFDANMAKLHQDLVKATFDNKVNRVKFSQDQTAFNLDLRNKMTAIGATQALRYKDPEDLATQFTTNPDAKAAHLGKAGMILPIDDFDKDGYVTGGTAWILPEDKRHQLNPVAMDVPYTTIDKDGNTVVQNRHIEPRTMEMGDIFGAMTGALDQGNKAAQTGHQMRVDQQQANAQTKQAETQAKVATSTIAENYAAAGEHKAKADLLGGGSGANAAATAGLKGEEYLKAAVDPDMWNQVRAMAAGKLKMPPAGTRNPQAMAMRNAVLNFDPTATEARYDTRQNFQTKGDSTTLKQLSTALAHLEDAKGSIDFTNPYGTQATKYQTAVENFTHEAGRLIATGVLSDTKYEELKKRIASPVPYVRKAALDETVNLLGGSVKAQFEKYKRGSQQDIPLGEFFEPETQARLTRYGITPQAAATPKPGTDTSQAARAGGKGTRRLADAMGLPMNQGKDPAAVRKEMEGLGYQVVE